MFTIQFHPSGNRVLRFEPKDVALLLRMVKRTGDMEAEDTWVRMVSPVTGLACIVNPRHPASGDNVYVEAKDGIERTFRMGNGKLTATVRWIEPDAADRDLDTNFRESRCIVAAIGHASTGDGGGHPLRP